MLRPLRVHMSARNNFATQNLLREHLAQALELVEALHEKKKGIVIQLTDGIEGVVENRKETLDTGVGIFDDLLEKQDQVVDGLGFDLLLSGRLDGRHENINKQPGPIRSRRMTVHQMEVFETVASGFGNDEIPVILVNLLL